jgi:hypothetical protein
MKEGGCGSGSGDNDCTDSGNEGMATNVVDSQSTSQEAKSVSRATGRPDVDAAANQTISESSTSLSGRREAVSLTGNGDIVAPIASASSSANTNDDTCTFYKRSLVSSSGGDGNGETGETAVWTAIVVPTSALSQGAAPATDNHDCTNTKPSDSNDESNNTSRMDGANVDSKQDSDDWNARHVSLDSNDNVGSTDFYKEALRASSSPLNVANTRTTGTLSATASSNFYKGTMLGQTGGVPNTPLQQTRDDQNDAIELQPAESEQAKWASMVPSDFVQAQSVHAAIDDLSAVYPTSVPCAVRGVVEDANRSTALYDGSGRPVLSSNQKRRPTDSVASAHSSNHLAVMVQRRQRRHRSWVLCVMTSTIVACIVAISTILACSHHSCAVNAADQAERDWDTPHVDDFTMNGNTTTTPTQVAALPELVQQVLNYLSVITLTSHNFSASWDDSPEAVSAKRLLDVNYMNLSPDTPHGQFRWKQRYALATLLAPQAAFNDSRRLEGDECHWAGVTCEMMDLGVSTSIGRQNVTTQVHLYNYALKGRLSADLGLLDALTRFNVSFNALTGPLPLSIGRWTNLEYFSVRANKLNGTLPETLQQWTNLLEFDAGPNKLSGSLPSWMGLWSNLRHCNLARNAVTGTLPTEIGLWSNLECFTVYSIIHLTGRLPESIGSWTNLGYFDVAWNQLTGTLPVSIGQWTNVTVVSFTSNALTGTIPQSIGGWAAVERAYFGNNNLTGSVPDSICSGPFSHGIVVDEGIPCQCCEGYGNS